MKPEQQNGSKVICRLIDPALIQLGKTESAFFGIDDRAPLAVAGELPEGDSIPGNQPGQW